MRACSHIILSILFWRSYWTFPIQNLLFSTGSTSVCQIWERTTQREMCDGKQNPPFVPPFALRSCPKPHFNCFSCSLGKQAENPIFQPTTTTFQNPMYGVNTWWGMRRSLDVPAGAMFVPSAASVGYAFRGEWSLVCRPIIVRWTFCSFQWRGDWTNAALSRTYSEIFHLQHH